MHYRVTVYCSLHTLFLSTFFLLRSVINASETDLLLFHDVVVPPDLAKEIIIRSIPDNEQAISKWAWLVFYEQKLPFTHCPPRLVPFACVNKRWLSIFIDHRKYIVSAYLERALPKILKNGLERGLPAYCYYSILSSIVKELSLEALVGHSVKQVKVLMKEHGLKEQNAEHIQYHLNEAYKIGKHSSFLDYQQGYIIRSITQNVQKKRSALENDLANVYEILLAIIFAKLFDPFRESPMHHAIIDSVTVYVHDHVNSNKRFETFKASSVYTAVVGKAAPFVEGLESNRFLQNSLPQLLIEKEVSLREQIKEYFFKALYESVYENTCVHQGKTVSPFWIFPFYAITQKNTLLMNEALVYFRHRCAVYRYSDNAKELKNLLGWQLIDTIKIDEDIKSDSLPLLANALNNIFKDFFCKKIVYSTYTGQLPFTPVEFLSLIESNNFRQNQMRLKIVVSIPFIFHTQERLQKQFSYLNKDVFWYFLKPRIQSPVFHSNDSFWQWWTYLLPFVVQCNQYVIQVESIDMSFGWCVAWAINSFADYFFCDRQPVKSRENIFFSLLLFFKLLRYMMIGISLMQSIPHKNSPVKKTILSALWCFYFCHEYKTLKKDDLFFFFLHTVFDCLKRGSTALPYVYIEEADKSKDRLYVKEESVES